MENNQYRRQNTTFAPPAYYLHLPYPSSSSFTPSGNEPPKRRWHTTLRISAEWCRPTLRWIRVLYTNNSNVLGNEAQVNRSAGDRSRYRMQRHALSAIKGIPNTLSQDYDLHGEFGSRNRTRPQLWIQPKRSRHPCIKSNDGLQ